MKLIHRIGFRASNIQQKELEALGINVSTSIVLPGGSDPLITFDVDEVHPNWPTLRIRLREWKASDIVKTEFSKKEINSATWLNLRPEWHCGYPQPNELDFGYREATYDLSDYCEQCGIGMKQKRPFQMTNEPKWGKRGILQLNWVFDEYFVTPEVWANVFMPHGIECRPVLNTQGAELKTVVQLVTHEEVCIDTTHLPSEEKMCMKCMRLKFLPVMRGAFPALLNEPSSVMLKTKEYFGSGASAHKEIIVSQVIAQALIANHIAGATFIPVADVNTIEN